MCRLLLVCPKGFHHVGAGILGVGRVEEEFEDEKAGDGGDEGVKEEEVGKKCYQVGLALDGVSAIVLGSADGVEWDRLTAMMP